MDENRKIDVELIGVHTEEIELPGPFLQTAEKFSGMPGTVLLMSGGRLDCARYHILAANPWLSFTGYGRNIRIVTSGQDLRFEADPFHTLRMLLEKFKQVLPNPSVPAVAGLFGYLAYDLKDHLENLPRTSVDDFTLPQICLFAPSIILVHEKNTGKTTLYVPRRIEKGHETTQQDRSAFHRILAADLPDDPGFHCNPNRFRSNFTRDAYMDSIRKIREYIASGHVYQVNMSQRFEMDFSGSTFSLFKSLYKSNPAPFFSYIEAGDHQIVSTSPERFIRQTGRHVETRPIKGTRPRGKTPEEDGKLGRELSESKKDDAELSMIVDLLRNDIGKVCCGGSVRVSQHKRLEAYENVFHLVSVVEGDLLPDKDSVDLITAAFPGGSITGCPKIRSMEIIDELEPSRRHIYTGSIGYISFHDTMDLSIAIRTATVSKSRVFFSAGGGIVYDSDPADEYEETLHKGKTLMEILKGSGISSDESIVAWINGILTPIEEAKISITDQGLQYGYGLFETIRVENGVAAYLEEHLIRFNNSWIRLMDSPPPDLTWDDIIRQVIQANGLQEKIAAVKIMATFGSAEEPACNRSFIVTARSYTHRLSGKSEPGLHLVTYPEPRQTPLADHKTLNYLYYYLAGNWAKKNHGDEALILNPDGTASETNTASLILINRNTAITPVSRAVLPGIMAKAVIRHLNHSGFKIKSQKVLLEDLYSADQVWITNSLMGVVPVLSLDRKLLAHPTDLWQKVNDHVLASLLP
ncbi:MAG: aminodeoxychorismate synthase component I [Desulfobacterales bacterium]